MIVYDFSKNSLIDVALLKWLLARALSGNVARVGENGVHKCNSGHIVNIAKREWEIDLVDI